MLVEAKMSNERNEQLPRLPVRRKNWYTTGSNSVLVPGLETANFTFGNTVRLCAAIKHRGALLCRVLERALSGASIQAGQKGVRRFSFPRKAVYQIQSAWKYARRK